MAHEQLVRDFFSALGAIAQPGDEVISAEFRYSGGNPNSVRPWFVGDTSNINNARGIPDTVMAAIGHVLSVLLFGTVHAQAGQFAVQH